MQYRSVKNWTNLENTKGLLFFVQRLDELTYPYSLDSYKASTTGIITLVNEALDLLIDPYVASGNFNTVKHIFDELAFRLQGNFIARKIFTTDIDTILQTELADTTDIKKLIRKLKVFKSEIDPEAYLAEITYSVINHDQQKPKKSKLDLLAREFAALLQYLGVSRDHINSSLIKEFFSAKIINNSNSFKDFCKIVYPHRHNFRVGISVSDDIRDVSFDVLSSKNILPYVLIEDELEEKDENFKRAIDSYHQKHAGEILICSIQATDANSAATISTSRINEAINFQKLFSHKLEVKISKHAVAEQSCCAEDIRTVSALNNHMHYIRDMKTPKAISAAKKYQRELTLDVGPDSRKFENIFNLHGISLSSTSDDIQIVNLWTCIETLVPSDQSSSKILNAVSRISPILSLKYYNRIILTLLFDVIRWNRYSLSAVLRSSNINKSKPLLEKFIELLREEANDNELSSLLEKCRDFELLRYRISTIATLLRDPIKARDRLAQHEKVIAWQFYRIYRCRNGIVHSGESPSHTKYLVENAHDYFDQSLEFCVDVSSWKSGFDTFESCFDYAALEYNKYIKQIDSGNRNALAWSIPEQKNRSFIFPELTEDQG